MVLCYYFPIAIFQVHEIPPPPLSLHRLHEFTWHGSHPNDPSRFTPKGNIFQQLCRVPSQFYFNVKDVRTKNDTLITVKLMLFYELVDVNTMVDKYTVYMCALSRSLYPLFVAHTISIHLLLHIQVTYL